ncbi:MAG: DNA-binding domain-containing protein [Roseiflexaceae bacterium]
MSIRYQIIKNNLKPGSYMARVIQGQRIELAGLIERIVSRTSLSTADVQATVTTLIEEMRTALINGNTTVIDGLATFNISLSGNFSSPDATISRENAQLHLVLQADSRLQGAVAGAVSYERVIQDIKTPIVSSFYDVATNAFGCYTPGSIVRLQGDHLKFDRAQADEGLFLRNGGVELRVSVYSIAGPRQLDALLPTTLSGSIQVIVRTRYTPNGELREGHHRQTINQVP